MATLRNTHRTGFRLFVLTLTILCAASTTSSADIILETATLGETGQENGPSIAPGQQWLAARFSVSKPTQVTHIGGHMASVYDGYTKTIFGGILKMPGPEALPEGCPYEPGFQANWMATTTFLPPFPSGDVRVPLNVLLEPGDYALFFGGGGTICYQENASSPIICEICQHCNGATGGGRMINNNTPIAGEQTPFFWPDNYTRSRGCGYPNASTSLRFVVEGYPLIETYTCSGFAQPFHEPISLKQKSKRTIPLKIRITDGDGFELTDADISVAPIVEVTVDPEGQVLGANEDDLLPVAFSDDSNQFHYDYETGYWQLNLGTEFFAASATYNVNVLAGDDSYELDSCVQQFSRE